MTQRIGLWLENRWLNSKSLSQIEIYSIIYP